MIAELMRAATRAFDAMTIYFETATETSEAQRDYWRTQVRWASHVNWGDSRTGGNYD